MVGAELLESFELSRELFVSLGVPGLFAVAFVEFFFLPVLPDMVLIPLALARPALAPVYAAAATAGSVLAGLVGYAIGRKGGRSVLESRFSGARVERAVAYFERSGFATIAFCALAPIPEGYELISVASGVLRVDPRTYLLAALLGRGGKYFVEVTLVLFLGDAGGSFGEIELYLLPGVVAVVIAAAYLLRWRWLPDPLGTDAD